MSGMGFDELNCSSTWEANKLPDFVVLVYKTKGFELLNRQDVEYHFSGSATPLITGRFLGVGCCGSKAEPPVKIQPCLVDVAPPKH